MPARQPLAKSAEQPSVTCVKCGHQFPINEALTHQLFEPMMDGLRQQVAEEVRNAFDQDLDAMRSKLKERDDELAENAEQLRELRQGEAELRRKGRELQEQKDDLERKTEEMRDEIIKQERERADERARQHVEDLLRRRDEERLEQDRAKDAHHKDEVESLKQQIERISRELAETQRKTRAGSQNEEGYARQDWFLRELEARFRQDGFMPVKRGQHGADMQQLVRLAASSCGTVLWEVKRAANWQPGWIGKLIADRDEARAFLGVIVTEALPPGVDGFAERDGVWITGFGDALNLAGVLREIVITAWKRDAASAMRDENAEKVYDYVMSSTFARRLEQLSRVAAGLLNELRLDRNALEQRWRRTEKYIGEILEVREAIPLDLLERLDVGTELPPGLTAELPPADAPL